MASCPTAMRVSTLRRFGNPEDGAQSDSATTEAPSDDPGPIPEGLVRTGHRCNYCGSQFGLLNHWAWPGYPDGIWLHLRCEAPWWDYGMLPEGTYDDRR